MTQLCLDPAFLGRALIQKLSENKMVFLGAGILSVFSRRPNHSFGVLN